MLWTFHRLDGWGRDTGPVVRRQRRWLEPRACAWAFGMGLDVESLWVGSRGLPWVFGSSFGLVSGLDWRHDRTDVLVMSSGKCPTFWGTGKEPSPPWSPSHAIGASSTLRAFEGEGEIRTEADVGASAPTSASSSVLGGWGQNTPLRSYFEWPQHEWPRTGEGAHEGRRYERGRARCSTPQDGFTLWTHLQPARGPE